MDSFADGAMDAINVYDFDRTEGTEEKKQKKKLKSVSEASEVKIEKGCRLSFRNYVASNEPYVPWKWDVGLNC